MLFLFWFGKLVTEFLGSKKLISLYILGGLVGGLFYMLMYNFVPYYQDQQSTALMIVASAGVYAVVAGAATYMPNYTFFLLFIGPVRIKYIAIFYIILSFSQTIGTNAGGELAHLAGAGLGFFYIIQLRKGNDHGVWVISVMNFFKSFFVSQSKIKVTHRADTGRPAAKNSTKTSSRPVASDQEEIDVILDKISQKGYESLSKEEKQKLFNASNK
jgi:MFS family permease